ncbi:hypothetical protein CO540_18410 [Micromonospora sp. WMMA2032]|uniref:Peptidase inhibitor family I36 n=1 Tax=Micromonospora sediminicola TaxID=946078 RepID=A0A1A9B2J6_9ACTN|nr:MULTISPECIES: hypothetical protein [Micromonospora]ATO15568.1 hypothetical protein CO540_18410 [Micromonospora sp. WMMA2032]PGH44005.1 hypothetical protein COO58_05810 [Micromonospora sp. WMMA1996]SBT63256.1 hypothetical protein GA0070622_0202 [Micromonospora sediminicola]
MSMLRRTLATASVALAAGAVALVDASPALASTPSSCSSVRQIGTTRVLTVGGMQAASVKQYYGCGYNYAYIYVWEQYRASHSNWDLYVHVVDESDSGTDYGVGELNNTTRAELWGRAANTAAHCTHVTGYLNSTGGSTSTVC